MKKSRLLGIGIFLLAVVIYLIPQWGILQTTQESWWPWRREFILLSGMLAWLFMSLAMVLSLRLPAMESVTGGLDKSFILHKWAGIITLVAGSMHWLMEIVPKWMAKQGWITPPLRARERLAQSTPEWPMELASIGLSIAEWATYILIALCIISLIQKIPYRFFRYIHKIFPAIYLAITFHVLTVLAKTTWWSTPSSWIIVIVALIGSIAALISLFQRIGKKHKVSAIVSHVERHDDLIDIILQTDKPFHYHSGQFAFVHFDRFPEPHPYTIASSPDDPFTLRFVIKALGDDTRRLVDTLSSGEKAEVEGPYGCFDFERTVDRQIWVAGGIGVTPFLSRLTALAQRGGTKRPIDFWYCGRNEAPSELSALCQKAKVQLHTVNTCHQGRLDSAPLAQVMQPSEKVGVWFCGPAAFGRLLHDDLKGKYAEFQSDNFSLR
jgi:predicted ferric reductase